MAGLRLMSLFNLIYLLVNHVKYIVKVFLHEYSTNTPSIIHGPQAASLIDSLLTTQFVFSLQNLEKKT